MGPRHGRRLKNRSPAILSSRGFNGGASGAYRHSSIGRSAKKSKVIHSELHQSFIAGTGGTPAEIRRRSQNDGGELENGGATFPRRAEMRRAWSRIAEWIPSMAGTGSAGNAIPHLFFWDCYISSARHLRMQSSYPRTWALVPGKRRQPHSYLSKCSSKRIWKQVLYRL